MLLKRDCMYACTHAIAMKKRLQFGKWYKSDTCIQHTLWKLPKWVKPVMRLQGCKPWKKLFINCCEVILNSFKTVPCLRLLHILKFRCQKHENCVNITQCFWAHERYCIWTRKVKSGTLRLYTNASHITCKARQTCRSNRLFSSF